MPPPTLKAPKDSKDSDEIRCALIDPTVVGTALRDSAFPQSKATPQVLSAAKNNMVALPGQLFYNTQISICLWFLAKSKASVNRRMHRRETRLIDTRKMGHRSSSAKSNRCCMQPGKSRA